MKNLNSKFAGGAAVIFCALLGVGVANAVEEASWGQVKQTNSTLAPAAKRTKDPVILEEAVNATSVAADYGTEGGRIVLKASGSYGLRKGDLRVSFTVPEDALAEGEFIEMNIYPGDRRGRRLPAGTRLRADNLVVNFGPNGLVFQKTCRLRIAMGPALLEGVKIDRLVPTHWHEGTSDQSDFLALYYDHDNDRLVFKIAVDGFSRYGLTRY